MTLRLLAANGIGRKAIAVVVVGRGHAEVHWLLEISGRDGILCHCRLLLLGMGMGHMELGMGLL
jgi:hypothetical protein